MRFNFLLLFPIYWRLQEVKILESPEILVFSLRLLIRNFNIQGSPLSIIKQYVVPNAIFSIAFSEQHSNMIATGSGDSFFHLFEFSSSKDTPLISIKLGLKEINSIMCNHFIPSLFLAVGVDMKIWLIDIIAQKVDLISQGEHLGNITKVVWHPRLKNLLSTCSSDGRVIFYDLLSKGKKSLFDIKDSRSVLAIDYNKYSDLFVTGSVDSSIKLYDLRNPNKPMAIISGHKYGVSKLKFSPLEPNLLISGS